MDAQRKHEYIGSTEERSRSIYCNIREPPDLTNHTQYYSQDRSIVSLDRNKLCRCSKGVSEEMNCKGCHAIGTVEKTWKVKDQHNVDLRIVESNKSSNQNALYIHPDGGGVPYWSEKVSSFSEDSTIANKSISTSSSHLDSRTYGKVCIPGQGSYKSLPQPQIQHQQQLRSHQAVAYCKGRYCDEKYSYQHDTRNTKNLYTVSSSAANFLHCDANTSNEKLSRQTIDHRIINPTTSKLISSKDQHQSLNYALKCPQICPLDEQSHGYSNLYMSAPQFSSEKFTTIIPEKSVDYLPRPNTSGEMCVRNETPKLCENPIQPKSPPMLGVYTQQKIYQSMPKEHMHPFLQQSQQMQQQTLYSRIPAASGRSVHYIASHNKHKEHLLSGVPSNMGTQLFDQYQYSEAPVALTSSDMIQTELPQTSPTEFTNKEDMVFDIRGTVPNARTGLFHNPYNSSHSSAGCCKEPTILHPLISNSRRESSHEYQKYEKSLEEVDSSNQMSPLSQYSKTGASGSNLSLGFRTQTYCYENVHPEYINKPPYSSTPSTVSTSTVMSKTPPSHVSQTSQIRPKSHHMQYSPQYKQSYQLYPEAEDRQSLPFNATKVSVGCSDIFESQTSNSQIACYSRSHLRAPQTFVSPNVIAVESIAITPKAMQAPHQKKSQLPKPNYRELINQVHARRTATTEEELNMQIIKKTLNVDARVSKSVSDVSKLSSSLQTSINQSWSGITHTLKKNGLEHESPDLIHREINFTGVTCRPENLQNSEVLPLESTTMAPNLTDSNEKLSSSPLDLSIRTVKTKADSTNCKYLSVPRISQNNNTNCTFTLPRVNFTPNFSFPSTVDKIIPVDRLKPNEYSRTGMVDTTLAFSSKIDQIKIYQKPGHIGPYFPSAAPPFNKKPCLKEPKIAPVSVSYKDPLPFDQLNELQTIKKPFTIKSATKQTTHGGMEVKQVRPSVLETNPYASFRGPNSDSVPNSSLTTTFLPINQLPPDTSIMPLKKSAIADPPMLPHVINKKEETVYIAPSKVKPDLNGIGCDPKKNLPHPKPLVNNLTVQSGLFVEERKASLLPRKRSLNESEDSLLVKPLIKQTKLEESVLKTERIQRSEIPAIAVNERLADIESSRAVEKSFQAEIPCYKQTLDTKKTSINDNALSLKKEPISCSQQISQQFVTQHMPDTSSLIAARIRTKAELKGFTFSPPIRKQNENSLDQPVCIKEEPCQSPNFQISSIPELNDECKEESLLDFSWSKTCNSLVQQLLSSSKKVTSTNKSKSNRSEEEPSLKEAISIQNAVIDIPNKIAEYNVNQTTILANKMSHLEPSESRSDVQSSNFEAIKTVSYDIFVPSSILQKKISKMGRDKLRIQQEKRFAARLQDESSSETDNELDRRKSDRLKKPFKKMKVRLSTRTAKNRFSDCGSDSSDCGSNQLGKDQSTKKINVPKKTKTVTLINQNIKCGWNNIPDIESVSAIKGTQANSINMDDKASTSAVKVKRKNQLCTFVPVNKAKRSSTSKNQNNETMAVQANKNTQQKPCVKNVQCEEVNKDKLNKDVNKQKGCLRIGHNSITRSKRKRELELQLANSKVLRNEKIIRNSTTTTKIKRKYVRKFSNAHNQGGTNKESFNKDIQSQLIMSTRLRSRKNKDIAMDKSKQVNSTSNATSKGNSEKETPPINSNNDRQSDIMMEVYRYKRSLKIPPSLITIKNPSNHKIETSLPNLENDRLLVSKSHKPMGVAQNTELTTKPSPTQPLSIIDVLHSRVIKSATPIKAEVVWNSNQKIILNENINSKIFYNTEDVSGSSANEPSSQKQIDDSIKVGKKRHFSIFDTKVLQSKTRTESKMQQKREIIREIFVGEERPASAPPEITPAVESDIKMTYEQKYEQFLQQMNIVVNETNFCKFGKRTSTSVAGCLVEHKNYKTFTDATIKQEDDTESASAIDADEKGEGDIPLDNVSIASTLPLLNNFRRRKCGKYFRRKGSSGFDYIRKKKKPVSICTSTPQQLYAAPKTDTKSEADYEAKEKTEEDVCREMQKWVLNKGVGQSTMHKAARLGYIDVIVYCLDRLCMNPDQKDNAGYTPLHEACTNGWLEIAKILLQYGAKHSEAAHSGIRPLHEASENNHEEIVRLLLSYGADPLLATYSGQTPLMLASSPGVRDILKNHLHDVQYVGSDRKPWNFEGPWKIFDATEGGYDVFSGAPNNKCDKSRALDRSFGSNATLNKKQCNQYDGTKAVINKSMKMFDNINRLNSNRLYSHKAPEVLMDNTSESEGGMFEFEEADILLPPLYLLKDEGTEKWVLLNDLCNLLKVKSKDTLLNKIYPASSMSPAHKDLIRELKMSDFLEKAICLQLLCAGEKINVCASKVVLIKYNESVKNLLGVKTILMKF